MRGRPSPAWAPLAAETTAPTGNGTAPDDTAGSSDSENTGRWADERVATRQGIEIRAGLGTLAGLDDRPGEIPGLGPIGADLARTAAGPWRLLTEELGKT